MTATKNFDAVSKGRRSHDASRSSSRSPTEAASAKKSSIGFRQRQRAPFRTRREDSTRRIDAHVYSIARRAAKVRQFGGTRLPSHSRDETHQARILRSGPESACHLSGGGGI